MTFNNQDIYKENRDLFTKIYEDVDDQTITDILDFKKENSDKDLLVIFDDIGTSPYLRRDRTQLQKMINNCRHYKINIVFLLQRVIQVNPTIRENARIIYLFKMTNRKVKEKVVDDFLGFLPQKSALSLLEYSWKKEFGFLKIVEGFGGQVTLMPNEDEIFEHKKLQTHEITEDK